MSGKWKKTSVCHREPSGTQVEEIQDQTRKSERLEKGEAKNRYIAERYIEARFVPRLNKSLVCSIALIIYVPLTYILILAIV